MSSSPGSASSVKWSEVTAIFGGTFDPPHIGHRIAADDLFNNPGVTSVRIIPSPQPPHKPTIASTEHRIEMTQLNFAPPFKGPVEIDLRELERSIARPGLPTYSFDTISELKRDFPRLAFVIGTDQLAKLPTWHRFPELLGLCHWLVLNRRSEAAGSSSWQTAYAEMKSSGLLRTTSLQIVDTAAPAMSSSQIRETLARSGNPPTGAILPEVHTYLMKHRLYGMKQK